MVVPMEQWASQPFQDKSADLWVVMLCDHNEKHSDRMERSYKAFAVTFELRFPFPLTILNCIFSPPKGLCSNNDSLRNFTKNMFNFVASSVPADVLAPIGARTSAVTMMTMQRRLRPIDLHIIMMPKLQVFLISLRRPMFGLRYSNSNAMMQRCKLTTINFSNHRNVIFSHHSLSISRNRPKLYEGNCLCHNLSVSMLL